MALHPPFTGDGVAKAQQLYDAPSTIALMKAIGPLDDEEEREADITASLNSIAGQFAFALWNEVQASIPEREKEAARLVAATQKVLDIVGIANGGDLLEMFGPGGLFAAANCRGEANGKAATMNALRAIELLHKDALTMVAVEANRRRLKDPKAGAPAHVALNRLVRDLSQLYESEWGRSPGISDGNDPSGPLMRLLEDVTSRLQHCGLRFYVSAHSLRKVWQRLDDNDKMPATLLARQFTSTPPNHAPERAPGERSGPPAPLRTVAINGPQVVKVVEWSDRLPVGAEASGPPPFGRFQFEGRYWWGAAHALKIEPPQA